MSKERFFISILSGRTPETARTVLATEDPRIVEAVRREVHKG